MDTTEVSLVLPAYNEENTIENTTIQTIDTLNDFLKPNSFEILIAEDGCDDKTPEIADELEETYECVTHIHSDERLGRGGALEFAFTKSEGSTVAYIDTDLATDMSHLEELILSVKEDDYHIATGSRWLQGSDAPRPASRGVPSKVYNMLVRVVLQSNLQDHQCGFKSFDREVILELMDDVKDEHWFWDTEVLVKAQRRGYSVKEFPVKWTPKGDSKVNVFQDAKEMGSGILRLTKEFYL